MPAASREYVGQVVFSNQYSGTSGQTSMTADAEIYGNTASHSGGGLAVGADTGLNSFPTITVNQNGKILYNIDVSMGKKGVTRECQKQLLEKTIH